jgi:hypothetical protein
MDTGIRSIVWVSCLGFALACSGHSQAAEMRYPGRMPGPTMLVSLPGGVLLSNQAICAVWRSDLPGLKLDEVRDVQMGRGLIITGELFEVVLTNDARYPASGLVPLSGPQARKIKAEPRSARLAARALSQAVELPLRSADNRLRITWRALACDDANYVRQEIDVVATDDSCMVQEIKWLNQSIAGAHTSGQVDGSPVVAGSFFLGGEDPHALNQTDTNNHVSCRVRRNARLPRGEKLTLSFVVGVAPEGQMRRGFLNYLERERAHPYRPFLHYNSWYDIAWDPFALNQTNCLEAIRLFGERLIKPHGVVVDAMVFDDGWDDPQSLWRFHHGFPNGFTPLAVLCQQYHTHLGVWLSPFGGYGESRNQRLRFGSAQGYETNATGFSLAGPKYFAAFKNACAGMIRQYEVNHFKFDGIAAGMYAQGGADYVRDTEAMRRLMLDLRREDPNLYINLTTGSWPSPFWLRYADSVWRQGNDMGLAGKGGHQQQWLTYRDQEVYQNIVLKGPLFPLNSLMTQGVAYSRKGSAGDPAFDSAGFKDDVRAFFGSGTGLQELYIQPGKLSPDDWTVLAEAAKWSKANADVLADTHWIGGVPARSEVYGYASWNSRKGIIMLRNPGDGPRAFSLTLASAFELPGTNLTRFRLKSPWAEDSAKPAIIADANQPVPVALAPFGILIYEAVAND